MKRQSIAEQTLQKQIRTIEHSLDEMLYEQNILGAKISQTRAILAATQQEHDRLRLAREAAKQQKGP
jgi:hypothetical protein